MNHAKHWDIILENQGIIGDVVKRRFYWALNKFEYRELFNEGLFGFKKACEKYKKSKNCKLTTYAHHWIYQAIMRFVQNNAHTIRIPVYLHGKIYGKTSEAAEPSEEYSESVCTD